MKRCKFCQLEITPGDIEEGLYVQVGHFFFHKSKNEGIVDCFKSFCTANYSRSVQSAEAS